PVISGGTAASASLGASCSSAWRCSAGTASAAARSSIAAPNAPTAIAPSSATASRPATLATALLTPEATPAWLSSTAPITVVVSGATLTVTPNPSTPAAGKKVVQYEPPIPGTARRTSPAAAISGPTTSGLRAP